MRRKTLGSDDVESNKRNTSSDDYKIVVNNAERPESTIYHPSILSNSKQDGYSRMLRASTDSHRNININLNVMHSRCEPPAQVGSGSHRKDRKNNSRQEKSRDKGQERAILSQMSQVVKSLLVGSTLSSEIKDDLQLTNTVFHEATPTQRLHIMTKICVDLRN